MTLLSRLLTLINSAVETFTTISHGSQIHLNPMLILHQSHQTHITIISNLFVLRACRENVVSYIVKYRGTSEKQYKPIQSGRAGTKGLCQKDRKLRKMTFWQKAGHVHAWGMKALATSGCQPLNIEALFVSNPRSPHAQAINLPALCSKCLSLYV